MVSFLVVQLRLNIKEVLIRLLICLFKFYYGRGNVCCRIELAAFNYSVFISLPLKEAQLKDHNTHVSYPHPPIEFNIRFRRHTRLFISQSQAIKTSLFAALGWHLIRFTTQFVLIKPSRFAVKLYPLTRIVLFTRETGFHGTLSSKTGDGN